MRNIDFANALNAHTQTQQADLMQPVRDVLESRGHSYFYFVRVKEAPSIIIAPYNKISRSTIDRDMYTVTIEAMRYNDQSKRVASAKACYTHKRASEYVPAFLVDITQDNIPKEWQPFSAALLTFKNLFPNVGDIMSKELSARTVKKFRLSEGFAFIIVVQQQYQFYHKQSDVTGALKSCPEEYPYHGLNYMQLNWPINGSIYPILAHKLTAAACLDTLRVHNNRQTPNTLVPKCLAAYYKNLISLTNYTLALDLANKRSSKVGRNIIRNVFLGRMYLNLPLPDAAFAQWLWDNHDQPSMGWYLAALTPEMLPDKEALTYSEVREGYSCLERISHINAQEFFDLNIHSPSSGSANIPDMESFINTDGVDPDVVRARFEDHRYAILHRNINPTQEPETKFW